MAPPSAASTDGIRRQVRRVWWGRNLLAAQVALFGATAALAAVVAGLVLLALRTSPRTFAAGLVVSAVALVAALALVAGRARRTWVRRRDAAAWIDRTAGLDGRLTTLLALEGRASFLLPLLRAQNDDARARWTPDRMIPSPFPPIALGAALVAGAALLAVLLAAPSLRPPPPQLVHGGGGGGATPIGGLDALVERLLAAIGTPDSSSGEPSADTDGVTGGGGDEEADTTVAYLPAALQASIRRQLWGERFATTPSPDQHDDAGGRGDRRPSRTPKAQPGTDATGDDVATDVRPADQPGDDTRTASTGDAASGAGTGSDPNLLGAATADGTSDDHFALGLAARVLGRRAGTSLPSGGPPPRDIDQHPALAARQRPDEPFHSMPVPPAYSAIVRSLFARTSPPGGSP